MKKIVIYFLIGMLSIAFNSCKKDKPLTDPNSTNTNNNDGEGNNSDSDYKWEFDIKVKTDIVTDQQDNAYFIGCDADDNYAIYSVDKTGQKNWSTSITNPDFYNLRIMLAVDKIVVSYRWDNLACYSTNDGSQVWEKTLQNGYKDMAYSNGKVYVAEYSILNNVFVLSSVSLSSGATNWEKNVTKLNDPRLSVDNNIICVAGQDKEPYPYQFGFNVYKDNGSSCDLLWSNFKESVSGNTVISHKAIFDGQGNLYYEDETSGNTVVYSYNETTGTENWNVQIKDIVMANKVAMIYTQGKLIATYRSDDSWGIENSFAVIDASNGSILNSVEEGIHSEDIFLLTGDNALITYTQDDNGINLLKYSTDGTLISTDKPAYAQGIMLSSYSYIKINSDGDLYIAGYDRLYCADHSFTQASLSDWSSINGNNYNTNSINY